MLEPTVKAVRHWIDGIPSLHEPRLEHRLLIGIARQTRDSALSTAVFATIVAALYSYSGSPILLAEPQLAWFWCAALLLWSVLALLTGRRCLADRSLRRRLPTWRRRMILLFSLNGLIWTSLLYLEDWSANPTGEVLIVLVMIGLMMGFLVDLSRHLLVMTAGLTVVTLSVAVSLILNDSDFAWVLRAIFPFFVPYLLYQGYRNHMRIATGVRRQMKMTSLANELAHAHTRATAESRKKVEFFAAMSHELRTPLNAIIGFSDIIENEVFGPLRHDRYRSYIGDIRASGTEMLALVEQLLVVSEAEDDQPCIAPEEVPTGTLLQEVGQDIAGEAERADITLSLRDEASCRLLIDRNRFRHSLGALLMAAIGNMEPHQSLTVTVSLDEHGACVIGVRSGDEGKAGALLTLSRDPFEGGMAGDEWIADARFSRHLGLYVAQRLIRAHDGTLEADALDSPAGGLRIVLPASRVLLQAQPASLAS